MTLPSATTRLSDESGGLTTGTNLVVVFAPVTTLDDETPRLYYSSQAIYAAHGYSQGLDYAAIHMQAAGLPVHFVPCSIGTQGAVSRVDTSGNSNTCVVSVAAGGNGALEETDGEVVVVAGGTIGTDQIRLNLTLDGGRTFKPVRLGTEVSFAIPYVGLTLSFAAGDLTTGETVLTWHSSAPIASAASIALGKTALAAQQKQARRWLLVGDVATDTDTTFAAFQTAVEAYETTDERYLVGKAQVRARLPVASMSRTTVRMTGSPNITFAEVGPTADTITRSAGSFVTDGFVTGQRITITGAVAGGGANNLIDVVLANVAATVLTLGSDDLLDEGPIAGVAITGSPGITFLEVGVTGDTITRSSGSWLTDGFRVGDNITIAGTSLNDKTTTAGLANVTALVITLGADDLVDESIRADLITITSGETKALFVAAMDAEFAPIDDAERIDLGLGRGGMISPVTGWKFRRPVQWADMILAFIEDVSQTTWHKDKGTIRGRIPAGFDLTDADGQPYEHDERVDGGALAARFTCARTWSNGPVGAFIAQSLTRATDGSILGYTHNMDVANLCQTIVQRVTENFAGATLILQEPEETGEKYATPESLAAFEGKVDDELARYLLSNIGGAGPRCSSVKWNAATDDDLGIADATLHGTCELNLKGTIVHISTTVAVK